MSEKIEDEVIAVKGKGKWRSKFVCMTCKGTTWKTVVKGKDYLCTNCGKMNTGVLFVWDAVKKGLVMWVPPPPPPPKPVELVPAERVEPAEHPATPEELVAVQEVLAAMPCDAKVLDIINGVEPKDGVEPVLADPTGQISTDPQGTPLPDPKTLQGMKDEDMQAAIHLRGDDTQVEVKP